MGYLWQQLWDILGKTMGYIGQNYGMFWAKTIGDISGYSWQKLWDILGKNYGIYYGIYWLKIVGYICQNYGIYYSIGYVN